MTNDPPPNFRRARGLPGASCLNCIHELRHNTRPVCVRYLCYVPLWRICDDWEPGGRAMEDLEGITIGWHRDDTESEEQEAFLNSQALGEQE